MFCRKCGEKLDAVDKVCGVCGEPVVFVSSEESAPNLEPPKDLVWNIEGFPKEKKIEDVIFDWKNENKTQDSIVDDFYFDDKKNESAQNLLDKEIEKLNINIMVREEAMSQAQEMARVRGAFFEETEKIESDVIESRASEPEPEPESEAVTEPQLESEPESKPILETVPEPVTVPEPEAPRATENPYGAIFMDEDEPEEKSFSWKKFILILLIILIILECAFLGFKYFMPENPYVKSVNDKVTQVVLTIENWFEKEEPAKEEPGIEKPDSEKPDLEKPDAQKPAVEKPEVQKPVVQEPENTYPENKNIKNISLNTSLIYVSGRDYGNVDINKSLPVTENTDDVIGAIVSYDSKWIDYVNNGDRSVIDITAPDGQARKNTVSFTKVGKIKETFNSLEIGEVRKGVKGYYIWVREEIGITENGTSTEKVYNWIYQVAPIENQMKIVNYFSYK